MAPRITGVGLRCRLYRCTQVSSGTVSQSVGGAQSPGGGVAGLPACKGIAIFGRCGTAKFNNEWCILSFTIVVILVDVFARIERFLPNTVTAPTIH